MTKKCIECGVEMTAETWDEVWSLTHRKRCRPCAETRMKTYQKEYREKRQRAKIARLGGARPCKICGAKIPLVVGGGAGSNSKTLCRKCWQARVLTTAGMDVKTCAAYLLAHAPELLTAEGLELAKAREAASPGS